MWSHDELHVFYNITMSIIGYCKFAMPYFQHYEKPKKGQKNHAFFFKAHLIIIIKNNYEK